MHYSRGTRFILKLAKLIKNNWRDFNFWKHKIYVYYYRYVILNRGTYVMKEDWDNLIILDACRYDMFRELNNLSGVLEHRISRGSHTKEFLLENFGKSKHSTAVYITGHPLVNYWVSGHFNKIIPVWMEGWHEEYDTVLPRTMVEYSLKAQAEYPEKRLIIHFVQPHYPFIGEKARNEFGDHRGIQSRKLVMEGHEPASDEMAGVWELLKKRKIRKETLWDAYRENLQITLPHVKDLVDGLRGKTVITSDHGNLFAERIPPLFCRYHGHSSGIHVKNLIKVPWFVIEGNGRKTINPGTAPEKGRLFDEEMKRIKKRIHSSKPFDDSKD